PEVVYQYAVLQYLDHEYATARASLEELLKRNVADLRVVQLLMETYSAQKEIPQGVARLKELAAANPKSPQLQQLLGQWSARNGDKDAARKAFESAKANDAKYTPADLSLADLDVREGRNAAAIERLNAVLAVNPRNVGALLLLAGAQEGAGAHAA